MRTAIYIDGFNFYYGAVKGTPYKWLDLKVLCQRILKPQHQIISIVYCTALVRPKPHDLNAPLRQATYFKALSLYIPEIKIIEGHFLENKTQMRPVNQKQCLLIQKDSLRFFKGNTVVYLPSLTI
jgi:hypothetical protein